MPARTVINEGDRFGKLTVIREVEPNITPCGTKQRKFLCRCECGNEVVRLRSTLVNGAKSSCGCEPLPIAKLNKKYESGTTDSYLYTTWCGMRQRCNNPNSSSYPRYGGRGISVCDEWNNDFLAFKKWAKENGARKGLTIDRINNDGDYCPDNCRWADLIVQANNKRTNRIITYNGESHTVMEWSRLTGIQEGTIRSRLDKYGCTIGQALGFEEYEVQKSHLVEYNGEIHTISEWGRITGISPMLIGHRIAQYGFSVGEALGFVEHDYKAKPKSITYQGETHNLTEWGEITGLSRRSIANRLKNGCSVAQSLGYEPVERRKSTYVPTTRHILEYDMDGKFVKEWVSASKAASFYGASATAIRYACLGVTHSSCGRIWKYKE